MGKRGPQPTDIGGLLRWEQEWTYALRLLRDGIPGEQREVGEGEAGPIQPIIWKTQNLASVLERTDIWESLLRARKVREVHSVCKDWETNLTATIHNRGRRTAVSGYVGLVIFPRLLSKHAVHFLATIRDKRFPRAPYSHEARLQFLARGLAGAMLRLSPATAIDRLRKLKHGRGGHLWNPQEKRCMCWHCTPAGHFADLVFGGGKK
jgi:hypothetical protein